MDLAGVAAGNGHSKQVPGRFERILLDGGRGGRRFAAAAARTRAEITAASDHTQAIRDVAAGVAAPLLVAYVIWILYQARARGTERLYFLSRDGHVLANIADVLAPRLGITVERRYLYASRQAWNRAAGTSQLSRWLWRDMPANVTLDDILRRLTIPRAAVEADLAEIGFVQFEAALGKAEIRRLRAYLESSRFASVAAAAVAENRNLLLAYLEQEGVFDTSAKAMVDLGWAGSQHETLCDLLAERGTPPCLCYLFGAKALASPWADQRRGYYFDEGAIPATDPVHVLVPRDLYVLMEMMCSTDHGTLTGFRRNGTQVEPVLAAGRTAEVTAWGLPLLHRTLAAVANAIDLTDFDPAEIDPNSNAAFRTTIDRLLEGFWLAPSATEAAAWGRFPWDAGQGHEDGAIPLAEPYSLRDISSAWRQGTLKKRDIFWVAGAVAMTPTPVTTALRGAAGTRRWAGRLRRTIGRVAVPRGT